MAKKYIDSEKLIAEIERLSSSEHPIEYESVEKLAYNRACSEIENAITSLQQEQPDVDLEKELDKYLHGEFKQTAGGNFNNYIQVARHFYELGLNARKEE